MAYRRLNRGNHVAPHGSNACLAALFPGPIRAAPEVGKKLFSMVVISSDASFPTNQGRDFFHACCEKKHDWRALMRSATRVPLFTGVDVQGLAAVRLAFSRDISVNHTSVLAPDPTFLLQASIAF